VPSSRRELTGLTLGGSAEPWRAFGFAVGHDGEIHVGGVRLAFAGGAPGIRGWELDGVPGRADAHPNGVTGIDHVVLLTRDLDAKVAELKDDGFDHRRTDPPRAFFVLGACLLELVQADREGFWGITFVSPSVDDYPNAKDAVQPGRRIATVRREAGLGLPVALITPR
jgi:hypothetical protein